MLHRDTLRTSPYVWTEARLAKLSKNLTSCPVPDRVVLLLNRVLSWKFTLGFHSAASVRALVSSDCRCTSHENIHRLIKLFWSVFTGKTSIKFYFKSRTKVKNLIYDYTIEEMIADIGGFTGLLMGVSAVNITVIINKLVIKFVTKYNIFSKKKQ